MKVLNKFKSVCYLFLIVSAMIATMGSSYMQTSTSRYVDGTNGSDTNNGLGLTTSWKTIQKAVSNAKPGDTIFVRSGTYNENIVVSVSGTAASPITLSSYPGETVVLNGGTGYAIRNSGLVSYWTIDGLTIKSANRYTLRLGWWGEPMTDHWTVRNNKLFGANFIMGSYHLWENNTIDGTGYTGTSGDAGISDGGDSHHNTYRYNTVKNFTNVDARGIWTQGKTHDSVIEYNTVTNIKTASGLGQCIDLDGAAQVEWRHTVRGNTVSNCSYVGIQLENVFASIVEDNIIRNTGPAGIIVISYDAGVGCAVGGESNQYGDTNGDRNCQGDLTNNIIRQNIITTTTGWGAGYGGIMNWYAGGVNYWGNTINAAWGNNNGGINIQGTSAQVKGNSIKDNIISQGTGPAVCVSDLRYLVGENNNLYNRTNSTKPYVSGSSCSTEYSTQDFQNLTGLGLNTVTGNPAYVNISTGDLRLSASSAAIDKGSGIGTTLDADGHQRLVGQSEDIGAYEYGSIVPTAAPTSQPTLAPTIAPTTTLPAGQPTNTPTAVPTTQPTVQPTVAPTTVTGSTALAGTYDDRTPSILYAGKWLTRPIIGNYMGTESYSYGIGSTARMTFIGNSITVIYRGYPRAFGKMGVIIDGVSVATINQNTTKNTKQLQWKSSSLGAGTHTIVLKHLTGTYVTLDGVIISGSVAAPVASPTAAPTSLPTATQVIQPTSTPAQGPTSIPTLMTVDNVALRKASDQSSVYESAVSGRAVDGNTDGVYANNSVTHTLENDHAWWQVDLGNSYQIQNINVWTRTDCCDWRLSNFYVFVSDQPFTSTDLTATMNQSGVSNYYVAGLGGRPTTAAINRTGRYVRVQLSGRDSLSLAEVQVIANTTPVTNLTNVVAASGLAFDTVLPTSTVTLAVQDQTTALPQVTATPTMQFLPGSEFTPTYSLEMTPTP